MLDNLGIGYEKLSVTTGEVCYNITFQAERFFDLVVSPRLQHYVLVWEGNIEGEHIDEDVFDLMEAVLGKSRKEVEKKAFVLITSNEKEEGSGEYVDDYVLALEDDIKRSTYLDLMGDIGGIGFIRYDFEVEEKVKLGKYSVSIQNSPSLEELTFLLPNSEEFSDEILGWMLQHHERYGDLDEERRKYLVVIINELKERETEYAV